MDICCQQLGGISQLDICIDIGYILPTIGGYTSLESCLGALWAQVLEMSVICICINILGLNAICQHFGACCNLDGVFWVHFGNGAAPSILNPRIKDPDPQNPKY